VYGTGGAYFLLKIIGGSVTKPSWLVVEDYGYHPSWRVYFTAAITGFALASVEYFIPYPAMWRGRWAFSTGHYDRAIAAFTKAMKTNPTDACAYSNIAKCHIRRWIGSGQRASDLCALDVAIAYYTEAIRLNPIAEFYEARGECYADFFKRDYGNAVLDYTEAIRLAPTAKRYEARASAYRHKEANDTAIADYTEAIRLEPTVSLFNSRASLYAEKGEEELAFADYDEAILRFPRDSKAYGNRGDALSERGDYDRAIADYTEAIKHTPKSKLGAVDLGFLYGSRAHSLAQKEDYDRAIADYDEAIRLSPSADHYIARGNCYRSIGNETHALADDQAADGFPAQEEASD
jgi:tetratricopeptide (TPR) repeat protein